VSDFELIIVGGGLASARAIAAYRKAGGAGRIALISKDTSIPYHRPPLSKRYLRGEAEPADVLVEPAEFYEQKEVALMLETQVVRLDPRERSVETGAGRRYRYGKLLLATGAAPRRLEVEGCEFEGVFTLRALADSTAIREAAGKTRDAVVVGSGFIGMEVAASLTLLGLDVTLVSRQVDLFAQLGSPEVSEHLVNLYRRRGIEVLLGDEVRAFAAARHWTRSSCTRASRSAPAWPSSASASSRSSASSAAAGSHSRTASS
jgi:NADPH-dependent 2,4-dienoyl-CoA reductase/sulfur reductase-like enzyme